MVRREGGNSAARNIDGQDGGYATGSILIEPAANGCAINAKQPGEVSAIARLAARQQEERMEALAFARVALMGEEGFQVVS